MDDEKEPKFSDIPNVLDLSDGSSPIIMGDTPDWFTGADAHILFILYSGLTLSPSIIAENSDISRVTVSRRLNTLQAGGLVEKRGRGKYKITPEGAYIVTGDRGILSQGSSNNDSPQ